MSMTNPNPDTGREPVFEAVITPHRSLSQRGFLIVMGLIGTISFVAGLAFWMIGAWPVVGFLGLDVALIWFAFRANFRAARVHETVRVTHQTVTIARSDTKGRITTAEFNPYWARLEAERDEEFGLLGLSIVSRGVRARVGDWLSPPEREDFANALSKALHEARNTVPAR